MPQLPAPGCPNVPRRPRPHRAVVWSRSAPRNSTLYLPSGEKCHQLKLLESRGIRRLVVPIGRTALLHKRVFGPCDGFSVECFRLSRVSVNFGSVDFGHAGAGSITETLRLGIPMLVVVNETLMDNHQQELATVGWHGYLHWTRVDDVRRRWKIMTLTLETVPQPELVRFGKFVDRRMGFAARCVRGQETMTYIAPVIVVCATISEHRCEFTILHNTLLQIEMI